MHNIDKSLFFNKNNEKLFIKFINHPLIYWKLETIINNEKFLFDFITNISSSKKYNASIYSNVNFINDPCLIFKNNEFINNFNKISDKRDFFNSKQYINSYKNDLLNKLNENSYDRGVFSYQFHNNINNDNQLKIILHKNLY